MKSTAKEKKENGSKPAPGAFVECGPAPGPDERLVCIAQAAYRKAELRGFAPGHEVADWLEAETEYNQTTGQ